MKYKIVLGTVLTVALFSATAVAASAAERETGGYLTGRQENETRHTQFQQAAELQTDEDREAFFRDHGIGGTGETRQLDARELAEAGVIDQDTADAILEHAGERQEGIHGRYTGMDALSPTERHERFQSFSRGADPVEELLEAGVITQEQADAIGDYLAQ